MIMFKVKERTNLDNGNGIWSRFSSSFFLGKSVGSAYMVEQWGFIRFKYFVFLWISRNSCYWFYCLLFAIWYHNVIVWLRFSCHTFFNEISTPLKINKRKQFIFLHIMAAQWNGYAFFFCCRKRDHKQTSKNLKQSFQSIGHGQPMTFFQPIWKSL